MVAEKEAGFVVSVELQANRSPSSPVAREMLPTRLKASKIFQLMPNVLKAERSKGEMIERRLNDREGE